MFTGIKKFFKILGKINEWYYYKIFSYYETNKLVECENT